MMARCKDQEQEQGHSTDVDNKKVPILRTPRQGLGVVLHLGVFQGPSSTWKMLVSDQVPLERHRPRRPRPPLDS